MIDGFDHVHLICGDAEAAGKYFETFLGGKIFFRGEMGGLPVVRMDLYGVNFFIFGSKAGQEQFEPRKGLRGLDHIGFKVKDLAKAAVDLKRKGAKFSVEPSVTPAGVKFAFIEGPDGMAIELVERK
jgi:catechol 2,3-dioxygenase-like lactoylglutathione lyase family enzyme